MKILSKIKDILTKEEEIKEETSVIVKKPQRLAKIVELNPIDPFKPEDDERSIDKPLFED